jgi:hypothetical protein
MKNILSRLKSPVVIIQLITIIGTIVTLLSPNATESTKEIIAAVSVIVNVIAGLNNPTDPENF